MSLPSGCSSVLLRPAAGRERGACASPAAAAGSGGMRQAAESLRCAAPQIWHRLIILGVRREAASGSVAQSRAHSGSNVRRPAPRRILLGRGLR